MGRNWKKLRDDWVEIIISCAEGHITKVDAARLCCVNKTIIQQLVLLYEYQGIDGLKHAGKNQKYTPELKRRIVEDYLNGNGSQRIIVAKYGLRSASQLQEWIKVYNSHGVFRSPKTGGSYMKNARKTTKEERLQIVEDCLQSGKNYAETAVKYQISYQQIKSWMKKYIEMGAAGLEDRRGQRKKDQIPRTELEKAQIEIEQLKHKLYLAEMERDLLKKLDEIERREAYRK